MLPLDLKAVRDGKTRKKLSYSVNNGVCALDVGSRKNPGYFALIDESDLQMVQKYGWFVKIKESTNYAEAANLNGTRPTNIKMHRLIMGALERDLVDHINGDGLDNRRCNLRICTKKENSRNRKKPKSGLHSKYKGVSAHPNYPGKYISQIRTGNTCIRLGVFDLELDAARAYNEAAKMYHGDFANLNQLETP